MENVTENVVVVKRGPGRPKKNVDSSTEALVERKKRAPNKPLTDEKLCQRAVKKYGKILAQQQKAVESAVSRVKERFVQKKAEFLDSLPNTVRVLVEQENYFSFTADECAENPDVSDSVNDEESVDFSTNQLEPSDEAAAE